MNYKQHTSFIQSLRALFQKGGQFQKAARQIQAALGRIIVGDDPFIGMALTNHGETRVKKCIKYDLTGFARLITVQDNGIVLFCFAGTHDDCDSWLNRNRGFTLAANEHNQLISVQTSQALSNVQGRLTGSSALTVKRLEITILSNAFTS